MSAADIKFAKIIAANPGFYVLEALGDDNGYPVEVHKYPVLGWALDVDLLIPHPITLESVKTQGVHILQPDGTVERANIDWAPNLEDWLKFRQDEYTEKKCGGTK